MLKRFLIPSALGLALITGTAFASNDARPGDLLFPVKQAVEKVQITLTPSIAGKAEIRTKIAEDRLNDLTKVSDDNKEQAKVEATTEVSHAVEVLTRVEADLKAKGNTQAAAAIAENISRLKSEAEHKNVEVKIKSEDEKNKIEINDQDQDDQDHDGELRNDDREEGSVKGSSAVNKNNGDFEDQSPDRGHTEKEQD